MKPSAADLAEMAAAVGGTLIAARQWLEAGFSPGDAAAYVRAGCFDVDRTLELRAAGVSPCRLASLGLGWDYCAGRVALNELRETPSRQTAELPWTHPTSDRPGPRWRGSEADRPDSDRKKWFDTRRAS